MTADGLSPAAYAAHSTVCWLKGQERACRQGAKISRKDNPEYAVRMDIQAQTYQRIAMGVGKRLRREQQRPKEEQK